MTEYTKGPWEANNYDECGGYDCMTGGIAIRDTSSNRTIARLDAGDFGAEHFEHKPEVVESVVSAAHLIAAAPDMYEALKEHAVTRDSFYDETRSDKLIDAAIAKAEGKS